MPGNSHQYPINCSGEPCLSAINVGLRFQTRPATKPFLSGVIQCDSSIRAEQICVYRLSFLSLSHSHSLFPSCRYVLATCVPHHSIRHVTPRSLTPGTRQVWLPSNPSTFVPIVHVSTLSNPPSILHPPHTVTPPRPLTSHPTNVLPTTRCMHNQHKHKQQS